MSNVEHKVDYIITHNAPQQVIRMMNYAPIIDDAELTGFLDWVMFETEFKKWFFGHTAKRFYFDWELYKKRYEELNGVSCTKKNPNE